MTYWRRRVRRAWSLGGRVSRIWLGRAVLVIAGVYFAVTTCNSPESRLVDAFEERYQGEPWYRDIRGISASSPELIWMHTDLKRGSAEDIRRAIAMCEAMGPFSPVPNQHVVVWGRTVVPGTLNVDGSRKRDEERDAVIVESHFFDESRCSPK